MKGRWNWKSRQDCWVEALAPDMLKLSAPTVSPGPGLPAVPPALASCSVSREWQFLSAWWEWRSWCSRLTQPAHDPRKTPHLSQQIWKKVEGWKFIGPTWFLHLSLGKEISLASRMEYANWLGLSQMPRGRGWGEYWVHRKVHVYYRKGNPWDGRTHWQMIYLIKG